MLQIRLNRITPALPAAPSRRPRRFLRGALRVLCAVVLVLAIFGIWVTQPVWVRRGPSTPAADPARLQAHVRMLAETLVPRSSSDAANLGRCAAYIGAQLAAAGAQVSTQRYAAGEQQFENVIGQFGPAAGACVVIGAHYDAWSHLPGADDNASGVAGLLELARLLGRGAPPRAPVTLVAYCTEEPPFFASCGMGSYQHAKMLKRSGITVKGMISVEMIGRFDDRFLSQAYPMPLLYAIYPARGNYISIIGDLAHRGLIRKAKRGMKRATDLPVWSASLPHAIPGVDLSDHRNYWAFGFPAVMVTDTSQYRNPDYHQPGDTWDRLDYARMAKVVDGLRGAVGCWSLPAP